MKKTFFTLLFLCALSFGVSAQALQFIVGGTAIENNAIITVTEYHDYPFAVGGIALTFEANIKNTTENAMSITILKEEVNMPEGSESTFCAGTCYSNNVTQSPPINIDANSEYAEFHGEFYPIATSVGIVKYIVRQNGGLDPASATVEVHYNYDPTGIENVGFTQFAVMQIQDICRVIYNNQNEVQLRLFTVTGNQMGTYTLPAGESSFDIPVSNYKGVAIMVLTDGKGKSIAQKILIK